jgi:hypothetical protein
MTAELVLQLGARCRRGLHSRTGFDVARRTTGLRHASAFVAADGVGVTDESG